MAAPKAPLLGVGTKQRHARGGRLRRRGQAAPRARDRARRAERGARRHARRQEPRARRRRPREAVAPEGHRPRPRRARSARRSSPAAASPSRRTTRNFDGQGEPQGAPGRAPLRALGARAGAARSASLDAGAFDAPSTKAARRAARRVGQGAARCSSSRSRGRGGADQVVPQPRARRRHGAVRARGAAGRLGALAARHRGRARARPGEGRQMSLHPNEVLLAPGRLREELQLIEERKYSFRVHPDAHKTQVRQAVEELFDVNVAGREHAQGAAEAEAPRHDPRHASPAGRRRSCSCARARRSRSSRGPRSRCPSASTSRPRPGRRFMSVSTFDEITKTEPEKSLIEPLKKTGGRNNYGRITTRHQGGGHKRRYRMIDFKRVKDGVPAKVAAIEYDPNRSARIALLHYADGAKAYILAPARLQVGTTVESGPERRHQARQRAAAGEHPDRHARAQRRAEARPGRPARAQRRLRDPARREGRGLRRASATVRRAAPGAAHLPGHDRPGRQRRPRERHRRQGGAQPLEGQAPDRARLGDEPGRPPARRRRGQVEGRPPPGHARGACRRSASARAASTRNPTS